MGVYGARNQRFYCALGNPRRRRCFPALRKYSLQGDSRCVDRVRITLCYICVAWVRCGLPFRPPAAWNSVINYQPPHSVSKLKDADGEIIRLEEKSRDLYSLLCRRFSDEGGWVLDFYAGTFTSAMGALVENRSYLGFESGVYTGPPREFIFSLCARQTNGASTTRSSDWGSLLK